MNEKEYRLENWEIRCQGGSIPKAYATGIVYDNPKFPDGTEIVTSQIVEMEIEQGYIKTLNSKYILGKKKGD